MLSCAIAATFLAAAGLYSPFQPPTQVEIGFSLASGVGVGGTF